MGNVASNDAASQVRAIQRQVEAARQAAIIQAAQQRARQEERTRIANALAAAEASRRAHLPPPQSPRGIDPHLVVVPPSHPGTYHKTEVRTPPPLPRALPPAIHTAVAQHSSGQHMAVVTTGHQPIPFTTKLELSLKKTGVLASAATGAAVGSISAESPAMRVAFGALGFGMPVLAYILISKDEQFL